MLPNKEIIAFDLDGTLTVSKSPVTEEMVNLFKQLVKKSKVFITSGGSFHQFQTQFLATFYKDDSFMSFIDNLTLLPTSASQVYRFDKVKKEWDLIDKEPLDEKIKEKAKKLLQEIIDSGQYEIPLNPEGEIIEDRDTQLTFSALGQKAKIEAKRLWDPDQRKRKKIKAVLEPELPEVSILINAYSSIDILSKGFNKAVGLTRLLSKMGLQKSDMVYIGDGIFPGGNDYSVYEAGFETIPVKGPEETVEIIKQWIG